MNYKKLGDYIREISIKNTDLKIDVLLGVTLNKEFIPSVANIIGVDMANYKIIKKNQLACKLMSVGRDEKIPVSILKEYNEALISSAYYVFEPIDKTILLPEYLMMWLSRSETDRWVSFVSGGDVRGGISWDLFCEMAIIIPSLAKQKEIVKEYQIISDRILLNQKINQNLERTAQALYKHWFVDFEFPDENGKPYQSSNGKMIFNEELDKEIPQGWEVEEISNHLDSNLNNFSKDDNFEFINYYDTSSVTNNVFQEPQRLNLLEDTIPSRAKRKVKHNDLIYSTVRPNLKHFGLIKNPTENTLVSTGFVVLSNKSSHFKNEFFLLFLSQDDILNYFQSKAEMSVSTYPSIKPEDILNFKIPVPIFNEVIEKFNIVLKTIYKLSDLRNNQNQLLTHLQTLLLSKMARVEKEEVF